MKRNIAVSMLILLGMASGAYADDDASKQIQMLNSQIQVQLQKMQEAQQKQFTTFSTQIEAQLKQIETNLQKEIQDAYNKSQGEIKAVEDKLQAQIQQVNSGLTKEAK